MIPPRFDYAAPSSLDEAVALLNENKGAKVLAGGHSLLAEMKLRRMSPPMLVDLRKIRSLYGLSPQGEGIRIGAMTTLAEITDHPDMAASYQALAEAVRSVGDPLDRNRGTVGGNLAWDDPATDSPAAVLALEALIEVIGPRGPRTVPADEFFHGPNGRALGPGEIITAVVLPVPAPGSASAYEKFKHPANHSALCGVAAQITRGSDGRITACRVALTGASDRAARLRAVEAALQSQEPTTANIEAAAQRAGDGLTFRSDLAASAEYRSHLAMVLTERVLFHASQRLGLSGHE